MTRPFRDLDPLQWARSNPQLFFRGGEVDAYQLVSWVLADVLVFGQGGCFVDQKADWWLVASNRDWLRTKAHTVEDLFQRVVAEPGHGGHSMRAELLVAAYCRDIFTTTRAAEQAIKGSRPAASLVDSVFNDAWVERALFFRLLEPRGTPRVDRRSSYNASPWASGRGAGPSHQESPITSLG